MTRPIIDTDSPSGSWAATIAYQRMVARLNATLKRRLKGKRK